MARLAIGRPCLQVLPIATPASSIRYKQESTLPWPVQPIAGTGMRHPVLPPFTQGSGDQAFST